MDDIEKRKTSLMAKFVQVVCEAGHTTNMKPEELEGAMCIFEVDSALMPGRVVPCNLPVKAVAPENEEVPDGDIANAAVAPPPGQSNEVVRWVVGIPDGCAAGCGGEKFRENEAIMKVPIGKGAHVFSHLHCFWKVRAETFEQLFNQAHQTLCYVVTKFGVVRIYGHHIKRATELHFQLNVTPTPDGMTLSMAKGSGIEVAKSLPPGTKKP